MKPIFIFALGLCIEGIAGNKQKRNENTVFTCCPEECQKIHNRKVTCKSLIAIYLERKLNICLKKCKCRKPYASCTCIKNICFAIRSIQNPDTGTDTKVLTATNCKINCEDPGCDCHCDGDKTGCTENEDNREETDGGTKDGDMDSDIQTLVPILVILLLCIILSTIIIIVCKIKRKPPESQRDERPGRGLPEKDPPQQKVITIYTTANNPEVLGKQNDHCYEEIPNAPPENRKNTVYVTIGPPPGNQQGMSGRPQQEDGIYSELASAEKESSI